MSSVLENLESARQSGYKILDHFVLPESGWWEDYYGPLESRIVNLKIKYQGNAQALQALAEAQSEIDLYRQFSNQYGYVFYLLRKA